MTFKRVVADSGLTKVELAQLYGVSRQMVHNWIGGAAPRKNTITARMQETITAGLMQGIEKGQLPPRAMSREARVRWVEALAVRLQKIPIAAIK